MAFTPTPIPLWDTHLANELYWCDLLGQRLNPANGYSFDDRLAAFYYDAEYVFHSLAERYPSEPKWITYAGYAEQIYRNEYAVPNSGNVPGFWLFPHGLHKDFTRTGDTASKNALVQLSATSAYARDTTRLTDTVSSAFSREVAYVIMTYILCEKLGEARRTKTLGYIEQAFGHIHQWFIAQGVEVRPFMFSLTAHALIMWQEHNSTDTALRARVIDALSTGCDWIWNNVWLSASKAFQYSTEQSDSGGKEPAADLNHLIAPIYAWLWYHTAQERFRLRYDSIFGGGVSIYNAQYGYIEEGAWLGSKSVGGVNGKHVCQNFRVSVEFANNYRLKEPLPLQQTTTPTTPTTPGGGVGSTPTPQPSSSSRVFYVPVMYESYEHHFVSRGWSSPKDQVNAGYSLFIQPTGLTAKFREKRDLQAMITQGVVVSVAINQQTIDGVVSVAPKIRVSADDVTYREYESISVFENNFRYVEIELNFVGSNDRALAKVPEVRLKITAKERRDGGTAVISAAHAATGGTIVTFNKDFSDVDSIVATAEWDPAFPASDQPQAYVNFQDVANPTQFKILLVKPSDGTFIGQGFVGPNGSAHGRVGWQVKGT